MPIDPAMLAKSIGTLADLDPTRDLAATLQQAVDAAKSLFDADAAGIMLADLDGTLRWAKITLTFVEVQIRFAPGGPVLGPQADRGRWPDTSWPRPGVASPFAVCNEPPPGRHCLASLHEASSAQTPWTTGPEKYLVAATMSGFK